MSFGLFLLTALCALAMIRLGTKRSWESVFGLTLKIAFLASLTGGVLYYGTSSLIFISQKITAFIEDNY